mmetsp:Transcript_22358/g.72540  ORF Transcript_22358/g.72540 Transcript_22358/m.72540 type:complete len:241 (+) Transcript_22358:2267-2989(+)
MLAAIRQPERVGVGQHCNRRRRNHCGPCRDAIRHLWRLNKQRSQRAIRFVGRGTRSHQGRGARRPLPSLSVLLAVELDGHHGLDAPLRVHGDAHHHRFGWRHHPLLQPQHHRHGVRGARHRGRARTRDCHRRLHGLDARTARSALLRHPHRFGGGFRGPPVPRVHDGVLQRSLSTHPRRTAPHRPANHLCGRHHLCRQPRPLLLHHHLLHDVRTSLDVDDGVGACDELRALLGALRSFRP